MDAVRTAFSQRSSATRAAADIRRQIQGGAPKLVLYFASSTFRPSAIAEAMEKAFAPATVIGCTTAGELVSGTMLKRSVVAMAFGPEVVTDVAVQLLPGLGTGTDPVPEAFGALGRHFGMDMSHLDPTKHVGMVLIDGLSGGHERLLAAMGIRTDVQFVGGSAGDDLAFETTHVFAGGQAHTDAGLVAVLRVDHGFTVVKTQSFVSMGKRLVATRVREDERVVVEFDGRPASLAYADALGVPVKDLTERFTSNPVGILAGEEPFVRSPQRVSGETVKFFSTVRRGMEFEILRSTDIVDETRAALQEKIDELGGVSAMVNFNGILRTLELEKKGAVEAYGRLFAAVPTIGFNTYGEEFQGHVNQTATILLLQ
jgi:hypothetical protein